MIVQDLWQIYYQILLIISQKYFTKLNVKIVIVFFEYESVKDNLIKCKCLSCDKDCSNKIGEFTYINLGSQIYYKKYNQKLHHVEYYGGK